MNQTANQTDKKTGVNSTPGPEEIKSLISDLANKNVNTCRNASQSLIAAGATAVKPLVEALASPNNRLRWEVNKILDKINVDWTQFADEDIIDALIKDLGSKDGLVRVRARKSLAAIGAKAVDPLVKTLSSKQNWKRWEAAKTLGQIESPSAIDALADAMEDEYFDVRWLAAEALIAMGEAAVVPLICKLVKRPDSLWLREGAHRVLHGIYPDQASRSDQKTVALTVLQALEDVEAPLKVPLAAEAALNKLGIAC